MELKPNAVDVNAAAIPNGSAGSGSSSKSSSRLPELVLVVSGAGAADGEFYIQANLSIGRNASNTVVLEQDSIERIHAEVRHGWCEQPSQGVRAWLALGPYRVRRYVARGTTTTEMRKMRWNDHWKNAYQARLTTIFLISNGKTSISIPCH